MKRILFFLIALFFALTPAIQPQRIVHCPTAGIINHGDLLITAFIFPGDGLRSGVSLGLLDRVQLGVSYGAMKLVGRGSVDIDPRPGGEIRIRLFHEGEKLPAIALGAETIGFGEYRDDLKRHEHKSRGAFLAASKNWRFLGGNLGAHVGVNYSFEEDFNRGFSAYIGIDKDFAEVIGFKIEYDLAPGDWDEPYGNGYGYLSADISAYFGSSTYATICFFDILGNIRGKPAPAREFFVFWGVDLF